MLRFQNDTGEKKIMSDVSLQRITTTQALRAERNENIIHVISNISFPLNRSSFLFVPLNSSCPFSNHRDHLM